MSILKELREKQQKLVADARTKLDEIKDDTPEERAAEIEREYDAIMAEHDKLDKRAEREEQQLEAERLAEERANAGDHRRPQGSDRTNENRGRENALTYDDAFASYVRFEELTPELRAVMREHRAQAVGTDSAGGYTVPTGFLNELIRSMVAYSPMFDENLTRQLVTASGNQIEIPTTDDTGNTAVLIAENAAAAEDDMTFGQIVLDAYKYTSGLIKVSAELMQDSAINVEAEIRAAMAVRFGRGIGAALTTGDGSAKPHGIVAAAGAGPTSAAGAAITFDDLIELQHSIDPAYRGAASTAFMMNDGTLKSVRKLKDANDNYIWQPANVQTGAPASLLGERYVINQAMANIALNSRSVLFGDMNKYVVRRVRDVSIRRLDELFAVNDQTAFVGFARVDGEILDTAAIKALVQAAA
jgi:HK97 family phage major capsid protein